MTHLDVERSPGRPGWLSEMQARAEFHGWRVLGMGPHAARGPDYVLIRRPQLVWIFCEPDRGKLSEARFAAFSELKQCYQEAFVLRPSDAEKVERLLR